MESVRVWRPADQPLLLIHGTVSSYSSDPRGEYAIGLIGGNGLQVARGRRRYALYPGDIGVWDPSAAHAGVPLNGGGAWECRLMVIEMPDLRAIAQDPDGAAIDLEFPDPIVRDPRLAAEFLALHRALELSTWRLERDARLTEWLGRLAGGARVRPRAARARRDPALARACELILDDLAANVSLDQLAEAAGVSKHRVVRLFRAGLGMPPHRFALGQRIGLARRLLERGASAAETAAATGFVDQSHLHRHFSRTLGITPGRYARLLARERTRHDRGG
jgi:AraC-like DNA-binding protein